MNLELIRTCFDQNRPYFGFKITVLWPEKHIQSLVLTHLDFIPWVNFSSDVCQDYADWVIDQIDPDRWISDCGPHASDGLLFCWD